MLTKFVPDGVLKNFERKPSQENSLDSAEAGKPAPGTVRQRNVYRLNTRIDGEISETDSPRARRTSG